MSSALCLSEEFRWNSGGIPVIPEVNSGKVGKIRSPRARDRRHEDGSVNPELKLLQDKIAVRVCLCRQSHGIARIPLLRGGQERVSDGWHARHRVHDREGVRRGWRERPNNVSRSESVRGSGVESLVPPPAFVVVVFVVVFVVFVVEFVIVVVVVVVVPRASRAFERLDEGGVRGIGHARAPDIPRPSRRAREQRRCLLGGGSGIRC